MDAAQFDQTLTLVDIAICLVDFALLGFLFFYKFPREERRPLRTKIMRRRKWLGFKRRLAAHKDA